MCPRLRPVSWLSAHTQGDLSGWRVADAPLPLHACPPGWGHHLASSMYEVQSRVHRPAPLCLTLSLDAPRGRPRCLTGNAWWAEFGAVRRALSYLPHGALSPRLRVWPPPSGHRADPVWAATA